MSEIQRCQIIRENLERLRSLDLSFRVFGSGDVMGHQYRLRDVTDEASLLKFERTHRIVLPEDYRDFVLNVGMGGVGPAYGIVPFDRAECGSFQSDFHDSRICNVPRDDNDEVPAGVIRVCVEGGDGYYSLIVRGTEFGAVWHDSVIGLESTGYAFMEWYESWLIKCLFAFDSLRLIGLIKVGMSGNDVIALLGFKPTATWCTPGSGIRYLAFNPLPISVELHPHRDEVLHVNEFRQIAPSLYK